MKALNAKAVVGSAIYFAWKKAINFIDVQLLSLFWINATERINFVIDVIFTKEHRCLTLGLHMRITRV